MQVQDMPNFRTMRKMNVISISKKRKRCDSIAQRAAMKHRQYKTQRGGRGTGEIDRGRETVIVCVCNIKIVCVLVTRHKHTACHMQF
jgi:hypothetical protein